MHTPPEHFDILVLNQIAPTGLARLPAERYRVGADIPLPHAVLLRSADMHGLEIAASVRAVARAGAGTNNIPVKALSLRGVPVFNAPGANNSLFLQDDPTTSSFLTPPSFISGGGGLCSTVADYLAFCRA